MKITNSAGLPQPVFEALERKEYSNDGADISVTQLIDSPRIRVLKKRHDAEIELEADSLLAAFLGTCFHKGIESGTKTGTAELRLAIQVGGWTLSGGMDHYHDGVLTDYKTATCWKTVLDCDDGRIDAFEKQLNVYAHILRENGFPVSKLKLFILFKDWNKRSFGEAKKKNKLFIPNQQGGYPDKTWVHFEVDLWAPDVASSYVAERVKIHQDAEVTLPECTVQEVWRGAGRCKNYCSAAPFCEQFKQMQKTGVMSAPEPKETANEVQSTGTDRGVRDIFKIKRRGDG